MYFFAFGAGAIALYFAAAAFQPPRAAKILAVILWAAYAVYEYHIANGTLCDPNCNIRVDLVLFLPFLGCAAYLALQKQPGIAAFAILAIVCLLVTAWLSSAFGNVAVAVIAVLSAIAVGGYGVRSRFKIDRT